MALILDSGGVLVAIDPDQNDHAAFADALASHRGPLVISPFVVAELDYMIARDYGGDARLAFRLAFLDEVDRGAYRLEAFGAADFSRARTFGQDAHGRLLTPYGLRDRRCLKRRPGEALAERYDTTDILTTDQRDFRRVELSGGRHFRILPYDL